MGYDAVPTEAPTTNMPSYESLEFINKKKKKSCKFFSKKSFWICCSNVELGKGGQQEKDKEKKDKVGLNLKHKKKNLFMCCSNVEFETEDEKEQVLSYLENNTKKSCVMMCFSNVGVGPKSGIGHHETPK
ncbi:vacuolar iron transporter like 4 [Fagus crenata]